MMKIIVSIIALVIALAIGVFLYKYPYGMRPCCLPCTMQALKQYAVANGGWYPPPPTGATNPLYVLTVDHMLDVELLAGISGSRRKLRSVLAKQGYVGTNDSTWVYIGGFRPDDRPAVAILWESREGVAMNGRRSNGHAVGMSDGGYRQISGEQWASFLREQELLRERVVRQRIQ
jgi:hypothetical protein